MFAAAAVVMTCLAEEFGANNLAASTGLFYPDAEEVTESCPENECQHSCALSSDGQPACFCDHGYSLAADGHSCVGKLLHNTHMHC